MTLTTSTVIEDDSGKYKLSALFFHKTNKYRLPSLSIDGSHWDNADYILTILIPFLKGKYYKINSNILSYLKNKIPEKDRGILLKILKKGKKLGFFNDALNL